MNKLYYIRQHQALTTKVSGLGGAFSHQKEITRKLLLDRRWMSKTLDEAMNRNKEYSKLINESMQTNRELIEMVHKLVDTINKKGIK